MFANVCTACAKRDLVFTDQIRSLRQTENGFEVRYVCSCGADAVWNVDHSEASTAVAA